MGNVSLISAPEGLGSKFQNTSDGVAQNVSTAVLKTQGSLAEGMSEDFTSDLSKLSKLSKGDVGSIDRKDVHSILERLINFLENNRELKLREESYNNLKCIIEEGNFTDELRPKFWKMCIDRFLKEEDKFCMLKGFLSGNCKDLEEKLENLDPQMRNILELELKNHENLKSFFKGVKGYKYLSFITLLEKFRVTITPDVLPSDNDELRWLDEDLSNRLRNLVPENEIKNALENMFETGDEKCVVGITYLFRNSNLWSYVDGKYRTPKYLNPHMKIISESFGLSEEDRKGLLNDLKKSKEIGEKYNACLVTDDMVRYANDEYINLILDTVDLDENSNPVLLLFKKIGKDRETYDINPFIDTTEIDNDCGIIDENSTINIVKNIDRVVNYKEFFYLEYLIKKKVFSTENEELIKEFIEKIKYFYDSCPKKEIDTIKKKVLSTENKELIKKFIKNFWAFHKNCTEGEIDTFIAKFIHVMTYEDVKIFKKIIEMNSKGKFTSPLLSRLKVELGLDSELPEDNAESPNIDPDDLDNLSKLLKDYDYKRSEENEKNIIQEVIDGGKKGEIIFHFTGQGQKYIFSIDYEKGCLRFVTEDLEYHSNIHDKYVGDNGKTVGGGRIMMNENKKIISLYDSSGDYGRVRDDYKKTMQKMLDRYFPDYTIVIEK